MVYLSCITRPYCPSLSQIMPSSKVTKGLLAVALLVIANSQQTEAVFPLAPVVMAFNPAIVGVLAVGGLAWMAVRKTIAPPSSDEPPSKPLTQVPSPRRTSSVPSMMMMMVAI